MGMAARGELSAHVLEGLAAPPGTLRPNPAVGLGDPLGDDDLQLALYLCYELHYRGLPGVDEHWEWDPGLLGFRALLEASFEAALREAAPSVAPVAPDGVPAALRELAELDAEPSLSRYLEGRATREQFEEFVAHRSAYQLKEADPHTFALPRLTGGPKAAMVEIQADEYGGGNPARMHSALFAATMSALGLDATYGAYVDRVPGVSLAMVNLMSLFALHRRLRGALVGQLALFEMTSSLPNRRYANGLRRLGCDTPAATAFYDEHVEADAVHENIAAHDLAGGLARDEPEVADDIVFGARALDALDARAAAYVLSAWEQGKSSLLAPAAAALPA